MKVFLGGTCNNSTWRDSAESYFDALGVNYFNPVVKDWTPDCQAEEIEQRRNCDVVMYTITPRMKGVYSIAEVIDDSNKRPDKTVLVLLKTDEELMFDDAQWKSLQAVADMVIFNGGVVFERLSDACIFIKNNHLEY